MTTTSAEGKRETSPFPTLFGGQASRIAALIRIAPSLAGSLALAPSRALHSVAAYLEAEAAQATSLEAMADALSSCAPRVLLARALPGHDPRLFRLLDRAMLPTWPLADLRALDEVLRSELADLLGEASISPASVRSVRSVLDAHPIARRLCRAIPDPWTREKIATAVAWLEEKGALDHLAATPDGAGLAALARRLRRDLASLRAPRAPFEIPQGWRQIDGVEELWAAGRELENCLAFRNYGACGRVADLLNGRDIYLFNPSCQAMFRLRHMGGRAWAHIESAGHRNGSLKKEIERDLADALRASGVVYLDDDLATALEHLVRPLRARPDLADAEDEDAGEADHHAVA